MTLGDLTEEDVKGIRSGANGDPTVGQVMGPISTTRPSSTIAYEPTGRSRPGNSG